MYLIRLPRNYNKRTLKFQRKFPRDHEGATSLSYMHKTSSFEEAVSFCERADLRNESVHVRNCLCSLYLQRSTILIIVNLKIFQRYKSLSHTRITCNQYNCKDQGIESGNCSDILGWRPFSGHNNALAQLVGEIFDYDVSIQVVGQIG